MKLIIEGTEEEIRPYLDRLAGEKIIVQPVNPYGTPINPKFVYPKNPYPPVEPEYFTTCVTSSIEQVWNTPEEDKAWENL
jgi:hypothetical protein